MPTTHQELICTLPIHMKVLADQGYMQCSFSTWAFGLKSSTTQLVWLHYVAINYLIGKCFFARPHLYCLENYAAISKQPLMSWNLYAYVRIE